MFTNHKSEDFKNWVLWKKKFGDFSFFTVVGEEMCVPCLPLALVGCTALEF
jgi:hypothetical protein